MYDVEAKIPYVSYASRHEVNPITRYEWVDIYNVPQRETETAEYEQAKVMANVFREFYKEVRVVKIRPGGSREVVRECPFTQSHTREWCGYSECRES